MYYLRTKAAADAIKFTVKKEAVQQPKAEAVAVAAGEEASQVNPEGRQKPKTAAELEAERVQNQSAMQCSLDDPEGCEMCGS